MAHVQVTDPFFVGPWLVEARLNQITIEGSSVRIPPKFMQVLVLLAEHAGDVVDRDTLLETVWEDTVVGEAVLTRAISELRKVFADDSQDPAVIETIPKMGYRMIAPVSQRPLSSDSLDALQGRELVVTPRFEAPPLGGVRPSSRRQLWWGVAGVVVVALAVGFALSQRQRSSHAPTTAFLQARPVTSLLGKEYDPRLSPDGRYLAFGWFDDDEDNSDVYVKDLETETVRRFTRDAAYEARPAWSPDGTFLAYVRCDDGDAEVLIRPLAADGPSQRVASMRVEECKYASTLTWSPDGRSLAYAAQPDTGAAQSIYVASVSSREQHRLTTPGPYEYDESPAFSPDGSRIAFSRGNMMAGSRLFVLPVTGGREQPLAEGNYAIDGLDWTADGTAVVFASRGHLWRVDAGGGSPQWITSSTFDLAQPAVARRGRRLAYVQSSNQVNIWRLDVTGPARNRHDRIIGSTRIDAEPRISPDGTHIAFISDRTGTCGVWMADDGGAQPVQLTAFDDLCMSLGNPRWSPSGLNLAFVGYENGQADVYVVSTAGAGRRRLTDTRSEDEAPGWSADGQWIYFGSNRSGRMEVWKVSVDGGAPIQVTHDGGYAAEESLDGQWLYFTREGQPGLWRMPAAGGDVTRIIPDLEPDDAANWRVAANGIYYVSRRESPAFSYFDLATDSARVLAPFPTERLTCSQADVAPDGSYVLFAQADRSERDIMLVDDFD